MSTVFFLYHFNDVDQIVPVIWRMLRDGERATAVMLDPDYDVAGDPRLQFLHGCGEFHVTTVDRFLKVPAARWLFRQHDGVTAGLVRRALRKILRESTYSVTAAMSALRRLGVRTCVFEWGGEGGRNRTEVLRAAHCLDLRTVCLPHGQSIFTERAGSVGAGVDPSQARADYNVYDAYVFQSVFHRDRQIAQGMDADMCHVLGSARYCPEWIDVLADLYPAFEPSAPAPTLPGGRLKVVFMLPHWTYNVDKEAVLDGIRSVARLPDVYLVIKEHTRGTGRLPDDLRRELQGVQGFEIAGDITSPALIRWADAVVCFGSSIALEACATGTALINPTYMHSNRTVFEEAGTGFEVESADALMALIRTLAGDGLTSVASKPIEGLMRQMVYGGEAPFDVLAAYRDVVTGVPATDPAPSIPQTIASTA